MEVDEEKIDTYNISVRVCLWFCRLDVALKLGCCIDVIVLGFKSVEELYPSPSLGVDRRTLANCPRRRICMDNSNTSN